MTDEQKRDALWERIEARFVAEDFDDYIHELVSQEASNINNAGLEAQFDYLYDKAGPDWLEELLAAENDDEGSDG